MKRMSQVIKDFGKPLCQIFPVKNQWKYHNRKKRLKTDEKTVAKVFNGYFSSSR